VSGHPFAQGYAQVKVIRLEVGSFAANAYLLMDFESEAGAVIDPGGEGERIVETCRTEGLAPRFIINTHGHVDHISANAALKAAFPDALLCIGARDAARLQDPVANLAAVFGDPEACPEAELLLEDGQELTFGAVVLKAIETPGHTPGSICLLAGQEDPPQLFCGDLIFRQGVGRTDLPGGDWQALLDSIRSKVLTLPDQTVLWPGHGDMTTLGEERRENPFLSPNDFLLA
jgi:glyoxylase-like metal-dependent hydrolase (beta-lactamase superfamily II)